MLGQVGQQPVSPGKGASWSWEASPALFCLLAASSGDEGTVVCPQMRSQPLLTRWELSYQRGHHGVTMKSFKANRFTLSEGGWGWWALSGSCCRSLPGVRADNTTAPRCVCLPPPQLMLPLTLPNPEHKSQTSYRLSLEGDCRKAQMLTGSWHKGLGHTQLPTIQGRACRRRAGEGASSWISFQGYLVLLQHGHFWWISGRY